MQRVRRVEICKTPDQEKHAKTSTLSRDRLAKRQFHNTTEAPTFQRCLWHIDSGNSAGFSRRRLYYSHTHSGTMYSAPAERTGPPGYCTDRYREDCRLCFTASTAAEQQLPPAPTKNSARPHSHPDTRTRCADRREHQYLWPLLKSPTYCDLRWS